MRLAILRGELIGGVEFIDENGSEPSVRLSKVPRGKLRECPNKLRLWSRENKPCTFYVAAQRRR
jgi:hypothetical protein